MLDDGSLGTSDSGRGREVRGYNELRRRADSRRFNECQIVSRGNRTLGNGHCAACTVSAVSAVVFGALVPLLPVKVVAASTAPQPINACTLLMASELSTLLGMPVEAGERHDAGRTPRAAYSSTCVWKVRNSRLLLDDPNASLGGADFAIVNVFSWPSVDGAKTFLQSFRSAAENHLIPMRPVALQIGDESLWWGDGVAVRKGAVSFGVSVVLNSADRDQRRVWEESLAKRIVTRIHGDNRR